MRIMEYRKVEETTAPAALARSAHRPRPLRLIEQCLAILDLYLVLQRPVLGPLD
jgi:hypothetical protein